MPKVKTASTASTAHKSHQSSFFVFTDGKKRVLTPRPKTYTAATATALRHFPHMKGLLTLQTDELDVCAGQFTDISPDIWEMAVETISSVLVKAEPVPDDGEYLNLFPIQKGGKPVIYLFSPQIVDVSVRLTLTREWKLSVIYPVVPAKCVASGGRRFSGTCAPIWMAASRSASPASM
ncbi:hypothetical protein DFH07DRAFT_958799 [Mycena maculata]|uniref:Uncharacterized protein n=1 Tax=Mycena maculata TaxID=230809 RepID=A0AAD7NF47_9AGAR|nr:hypothetical protein DFH07DRAFT_958799 [Mycena maculata]